MFQQGLLLMGYGLAGVFSALALLYITIVIMSKLFVSNKDE